eukprot:g29616.t1
MSALHERLAQRQLAFKRGTVGDLQRLRDFTADAWRQQHDQKLWMHRSEGLAARECLMEVDGERMHVAVLERIVPQLPDLRRLTPKEIPSCLAQLAQKSDSPEEIRVEALAALADLAGSNRGALLVAEVGALPLCVRMLQSSDEATREAAMRVLNQVQQNSDVF